MDLVKAAGGYWDPGWPGRRAGGADADYAAAVIEELFHAWFELVGKPDKKLTWNENKEELYSDYIQRLFLGHLLYYNTPLPFILDWWSFTGTKKLALPGNAGFRQDKSVLQNCFDFASQGRTIGGIPANKNPMTDKGRKELKDAGLDFEKRPKSVEEKLTGG